MEVHKPKPWHSLRELLKEIAIIVIGVLIALGAEQTVEALHTRHIIHEAEMAMGAELSDDDLPQAYVRIAIAPCLTDKLQALRGAVAQKIDPKSFRELALSYAPPKRTWDADAWKAAQSSVASSRMTAARLLQWSAPYRIIPELTIVADQESRTLQELQRTRYGSGAWTTQRQDELNDVLDRMEHVTYYFSADAAELFRQAKAVSSLSPQAEERILSDIRRVYGRCVVRPQPLRPTGPGDA